MPTHSPMHAGHLRYAFGITGEDKESQREALAAEEALLTELMQALVVRPAQLAQQVGMMVG